MASDKNDEKITQKITNKGKDYHTDSKLMLLYVLLKFSDENHPLSKDEILDKINQEYSYRGDITKSTLDRSLAAVKEFLEDNHTLFGKFKNGTANNSDRMVNIRIEHLFRNYEVRFLADMVSSCEYISIDERQKLIQKLLSLSSENILSEFRPYLYKNPAKQKFMKSAFIENLEMIHNAIANNKQIRFYRVQRNLKGALLYQKDKDGNDIEFVVNPYRTIFTDGFYYLICSRVPDDKSEPKKISNYRIDRMDNVEIISNSNIFLETSISSAPKNVDTRKYISTHRMMWGGIPEKIRFRCPEWAITEIIDYFGDEYTICSVETNAEMIVEVESSADNMLIWARRFFDFVEILSPDSLRQRMKEDIAKAYEKYSSGI